MTPLFALAGPCALLAAAAVAFGGRALRPRSACVVAESAAALAFAGSALATVRLVIDGAATTHLLSAGPFTMAVRVDIVSALMLLLASGIGWVVLRFSATYLDGEARQGPFTGWLCLTLAAVLLFLQAGTLTLLVLAFIAINIFLQRLILFYPDRPFARRAARKRAVSARLSEGALIGAAVALYFAYGTVDMTVIAAAAKDEAGTVPLALLAASLIAVAALVTSAQFPLHGWLTEVMETPTPVSALLHAGVVNAGGFLIIRLADVMLLAPGVLAALVMLGGFTALFGSLVMLTQPAVKTSLSWSTVAQMGFMIFQCGLALFPLALLHIIAHSLYKAHSFLRSGSAVEGVASIKRPGPIAVPGLISVARAFAFAIVIYATVAFAYGFAEKSVQAIALGAILIFGVAYLLAQGFADAAPWALTWRTALFSLAAAIAYFALQRGAEVLTAGTLPPAPMPGALEWALVTLALMSFAGVAFAQATFPLWINHPAAVGLRVHVANGLYADALVDRLIGGWSVMNAPTTARRHS